MKITISISLYMAGAVEVTVDPNGEVRCRLPRTPSNSQNAYLICDDKDNPLDTDEQTEVTTYATRTMLVNMLKTVDQVIQEKYGGLKVEEPKQIDSGMKQ